MNRAVVIGGEGYIGSRLTGRLAGEKWEVTVLAHPSGRSRQRLPIGVQRVGGDRSDPLVIRDLAARRPDVIFDLIAYNPAQTEALLQEGKGSFGRLVHLSTVSVYRQFPETSPATELRAKRFENGERGYGPEKAACERVLERSGAPYVIIRSAPIIGPEDPCSRENYFLKRIRARQTILHPGPEHGFLWLLFVDDLVDAFVRAATAPALGRAFHLANEDAPTLHEHVNALAAESHSDAPEIRVTSPDRLRQDGLSLYGFPYARTIPVRPDTSAACGALGWQPRSYRQALTETIAALQDAERAFPSWPGRNATQALLAGTHEWLHADIEARVLADLPTSAGPDPDKVLSWLSDDPGELPDVTFVESEEWPVRSSVANSDERFVTIPRELMQRLPSVQGATAGVAAAGRARLVAAIELDRWVDGRVWIYTSRASAPPMYGMSAQPRRVDIVSARVGVSSRPGPGERLLIESPSAGDIAPTDPQHPGRVLIEDIATWARKYPIGANGWLRRRRVDDVPAGAWVLSHCIARLLRGRGLVGSAVVELGSRPLPGGEPGLPPDAALCQVGRRSLVVDLSESRVIEIDPAIANVLNGGTDCAGTQAKRMG